MDESQFHIRAAGFEHAEVIFRMVKASPEELVARPLSEIVQNIDRSLVCMAGGEVAGTVSWQILPEVGAPHNPAIEIKSLAVQPQFRRRGIGTALVRAALDKIRHLHPAQVIVLTFTPEFFRQLGFCEVAKEKLMHKLYMGCINCTKYDSPFLCPEVAMALDIRSRDR